MSCNGTSKCCTIVISRSTCLFSRSEPRPAYCGVNRLWVCSKCRLRAVATRLMDCAR